jgi:adenosylcobinamide-GDP ribazoletransferase
MKKFLCALTFLTRLPAPNKNDFGMDAFRDSIYFYPLVGLIVGAILVGCWFGLRLLFQPLLTGALVLLVHLLLTGGLHLDGLMDTLDGLGGGTNPEKRLAIMKDSHVGAFGVQGAVMLLIVKFALYAQLKIALWPYLLAAPVLGRQVLIWAQVFYPYARKQGLGSFFQIYGDYRKLVVTTGITLIISISLLQMAGLEVLILAFLFSLAIAAVLNRLLGGLTGDTYGALCELTEVFVVLLGVLLVAHPVLIP